MTTSTTSNPAKVCQPVSDFLAMFNTLVERIYSSDSFHDVLPEIEPLFLKLLRAERLTIYQRLRNEMEIVSKYKTGDEVKEIRVSLSVGSIAGYVALNQIPLVINDIYDAEELQRIHPNLRFNVTFDQRSGFRTRSMVLVPIQHKNVCLGVMQILNCLAALAFSEVDLRNAQKLAAIIGQKFSSEFLGTNSPFDDLILKKKSPAND